MIKMNVKRFLFILLISVFVSGCTGSSPQEKPIVWIVYPAISEVDEGDWATYTVNIQLNRTMDLTLDVSSADEKSFVAIDPFELVDIGKHYSGEKITRRFKAKGNVYSGSAVEYTLTVVLGDNMDKSFNETKTVTLRVVKQTT